MLQVEPIVIKIDGKEYLFHFNNYALIQIGLLLNCEPIHGRSELEKLILKDRFQALVFIIYSGIVGYEKSEGNYNHGLDIKTFFKYFATADFEAFAPLFEAFTSSTESGGFLAELEKKASQKPVDKKKVKSK